MRDDTKGESYVDRVRADSRRYGQELLAENEKLRCSLLTLAEESAVLRRQLAQAQEALDLQRNQGQRLREQLLKTEAESRRFVERYVEVERQNSDLANLYVASYRLHSTLDRAEVLAVIHEIVANLVGCEEAVVFEASLDGSALLPVSSQGVELSGPVPLGEGLIGRAAQTGEIYLASSPAGARGPAAEARLTACIPFKLGGRVVGALALFQLLPQKAGFEEIDREMFNLLATHAAMALHCSASPSQPAARPSA